MQFSGGVASYVAAKRVAEEHGTEGMVLLFCDTKSEDMDLYRFLDEAAKNIGAPLVTVADGRTVWELFEDEGVIGNTRVPVCSRKLKGEPARRWADANCDPSTTLYVGIDWSEQHRMRGIRKNWTPYRVEAPLCGPPWLTKADMLREIEVAGIDPPRLYGMGYRTNNCGGACVKAGQGQWAHVLRSQPELFAYHERKEAEFRERTGKDVSILRDRIGGQSKPLPLSTIRRRVEANEPFDAEDTGGCGCFA